MNYEWRQAASPPKDDRSNALTSLLFVFVHLEMQSLIKLVICPELWTVAVGCCCFLGRFTQLVYAPSTEAGSTYFEFYYLQPQPVYPTKSMYDCRGTVRDVYII